MFKIVLIILALIGLVGTTTTTTTKAFANGYTVLCSGPADSGGGGGGSSSQGPSDTTTSPGAGGGGSGYGSPSDNSQSNTDTGSPPPHVDFPKGWLAGNEQYGGPGGYGAWKAEHHHHLWGSNFWLDQRLRNQDYYWNKYHHPQHSFGPSAEEMDPFGGATFGGLK